ncbi:MAG: hypothetical protein HZB62_15655 [Nitrospirae bacterium]|nr:hypothetical protein [Nitrospirota bacterium]
MQIATSYFLLKNAMDREKRILMETLRITKEKICRLAGTPGVGPEG